VDIRPIDLPELRAKIIGHYSEPHVIQWWNERAPKPALELFDNEQRQVARINPNAEERRKHEIDRLNHADLYFVSAQMTELAVVAAGSMPHFDLAFDDLPSMVGLIVFDRPIGASKNDIGEDLTIRGATWSIGTTSVPSITTSPVPYVWFSFYMDAHAVFDAESASGLITQEEAARQKGAQPSIVRCTDAAHILGVKNDRPSSAMHMWGRTIVTAWLLMQQQLALVEEVRPDRAARKRLLRAGREPASVRVIHLRRPASASNAGASDREYHHQWIVRGHWRQQWYPAREVHRPVWIAPHIKGPEGAPLIGGEKVYAWTK
jgi:hypothetical protein